MSGETTDRVRRRLEADPAIQEVLRGIHEAGLRGVKKAAEADPKAHRDTLVFEGPLHWRYFHHRGSSTYWCYSTVRNVAGYFLSWREVSHEDGSLERDRIGGHKLRRAAKALSLRCYEAERREAQR